MPKQNESDFFTTGRYVPNDMQWAVDSLLAAIEYCEAPPPMPVPDGNLAPRMALSVLLLRIEAGDGKALKMGAALVALEAEVAKLQKKLEEAHGRLVLLRGGK